MVPEIDAWDIELLLAVKGLPWDRPRADPAARFRLLVTRAADQAWRWRWQQGIPFVLFNMVVPVRRGR